MSSDSHHRFDLIDAEEEVAAELVGDESSDVTIDAEAVMAEAPDLPVGPALTEAIEAEVLMETETASAEVDVAAVSVPAEVSAERLALEEDAPREDTVFRTGQQVETNEEHAVATVNPGIAEPHQDRSASVDSPHGQRSRYRSWIFRGLQGTGALLETGFGLGSLVGCLAIATSLPGIQLLTLGYLIEASGRVGRSGKVRNGLPGLRKAARLGSFAAGTLLCLLPLLYVSNLVQAARLIEPTSGTVVGLTILQWVLVALIVPHMLASWFCGGKLRYFVWPLLAPYQLTVWTLRWCLATPVFRQVLDATVGRLSPRFVEDLCQVRPLTDFFVPAILLKHLWRGTLFSRPRDGFWEFLGGLHLVRLLKLGVQTLAGSVAWLFVPTLLLIGGTLLPDGAAVLSGLAGVVALAVVAMYLPLMQAHFGTVGQMYALFDFAAVLGMIRKSPLRITLATILFLAAAIPLYALKIEQVDPAFVWVLGLVFILFSLPARLVVAWAYTRAATREKRTRWFWRWPIRSVAFPAALFFAGFVSVTRFTSWGGAAGLFEQHAFLIPAPFLQWFG